MVWIVQAAARCAPILPQSRQSRTFWRRSPLQWTWSRGVRASLPSFPFTKWILPFRSRTVGRPSGPVTHGNTQTKTAAPLLEPPSVMTRCAEVTPPASTATPLGPRDAAPSNSRLDGSGTAVGADRDALNQAPTPSPQRPAPSGRDK